MIFEWDENKNLINKQKHNISFSTELGSKPTEEEIKEAEEVVKYPIVFDEDCPELSPAMMKAFRSAVVSRNRKKNA